MTSAVASTAWARGRLDGRDGPSELLFGRMHEDSSIERRAFRPGGRVFCIASAGCTAIALSRDHDVVAVDINARQIAYATRRIAGGPALRGAAERRMALGRRLVPLAGWRPSRLREFLELDDPAEQIAVWRRDFDTRRFRAALDVALSRVVLSRLYARAFLAELPPRFGRVLRARMERIFARHPNRTNPYARALLLGEPPDERPGGAGRIELVHADALDFLERAPAGSFDGFALSNILDGADAAYRERLRAAVRRTAAPGAAAVLRSFAEPESDRPANRAAEDRAMLWGIVDVVPTEAL